MYSVCLKNFNVFSLSQKLKDWGELGIQVYVKEQRLFLFNPTTDERLKEKSLKYCMFFLDKELV